MNAARHRSSPLQLRWITGLISAVSLFSLSGAQALKALLKAREAKLAAMVAMTLVRKSVRKSVSQLALVRVLVLVPTPASYPTVDHRVRIPVQRCL